MRMFLLFALALVGTAIVAEDASAFGRRKKAAAAQSSCCGTGSVGQGYGGGYAPVNGYPTSGVYQGQPQYVAPGTAPSGIPVVMPVK